MGKCLAGALAVMLAALHAGFAADASLASVRSGIEQWVQTRQLISRTKSDWEAEKESLLQSKALFEREFAGIDEQMSKVSTNSTQVDLERSVAERELEEARAALEHARGIVGGLEDRVRTVVPRLPAPLIEAIQPLLNRLPSDAAKTKMPATERFQTVVSVLNEIDKFNNAVTISSEKRKNPAGEEVAVDSVYIGLGAAYFVNQTGEFAGSGHPASTGWEWASLPSLAGPVREVIRIYRGERTAQFILLPVTVQ